MSTQTTEKPNVTDSVTKHSYAQLVAFLDLPSIDMQEIAERHASLNQEVVENVSAHYENMVNAKLSARRLRKTLYAQIYFERTSKGEKATEALIESLVEANTDLQALDLLGVESEVLYQKWNGLLDSYRERRNGYQEVGDQVRGGFASYRSSR